MTQPIGTLFGSEDGDDAGPLWGRRSIDVVSITIPVSSSISAAIVLGLSNTMESFDTSYISNDSTEQNKTYPISN